MKTKIFLLGLVALCSTLLHAQKLTHENYINREYDAKSVYASWAPGSSPNADCEEDENFFISRVKPMKRFVNTATQVNQSLPNERKLLYWMPMGGDGWTSLPRYMFNSDVFSGWSYVDIHGCWTNGFMNLPGAFADISHKNGVANAVVSQPAFAANLSTDGNGALFSTVVNGGAAKLLKLFRYYGIDGWGFNSECSFTPTVNGVQLSAGLQNFFSQCHAQKATYNMNQLHFDWYDGVLSSGSQSFSEQLNAGNVDWFYKNGNPVCNGFFLNYNWTTGGMATSVSTANAKKADSSWDVYCGMDWQGRSVGGSGAGFNAIANYNLSIGLWGAHNKSMLFESSAGNGSSGDSVNVLYQRKIEHVFTGSTKNPLNTPAATASYNYSGNPTVDFCGISKLKPAKSVLSWTMNGYFPFVTYFNMGNGKFLNNEGKTTFDQEWYNIGVQDYLPTWRYWISTAFIGRNASTVPSGVFAHFTWEDAWFGGSCLKVETTTATNSFYLHLFKTQFPLTSSKTYTLKIRYKVTSGTATSFMWALSNEGNEGTAVVTNTIATNLTVSNQWVEKDIPIQGAGQTLAMMALRFIRTSNDFKILIGEISFMEDGVTYNPVAPTITGPTATATATAKTYCTPTGNMTNGNRYLSSLTFKNGTTTLLNITGIQANVSSPVYVDKTSSILKTSAGTTITPSMNWTGSWMHSTLYVDYDKNGTFETTLSGNGGERPSGMDNVAMFSYLSTINKNSLGAAATGQSFTPVAFTIPAALADGQYRARFVIDWTDLKPCGSDVTGNTIQANGGCVCDFTLQIGEDAAPTESINPIKRVTHKGVDFKLIFKSADQTAANLANGLPIYNSDVDTWYFEIYSQQQGKDPVLCTYTTSWAAYVINAPYDVLDTDNNAIRFGVRAVSPNGTTKSDITWTDYQTVEQDDITLLDDVECDKKVIKENETFKLFFPDPNHDPATKWEIINSTTGVVVATFTNSTSCTTSLAELGSYDLRVTLGNGKTVYTPGKIQVSIAAVGATPKMFTLTASTPKSTEQINGETALHFDHLTNINYAYTAGRAVDAVAGTSADGTVSKGVKLQEKTPFAIDGKYLPYDKPITIAFWMKVDDVSSSDLFNLMALRTRNNDPACYGCWAFGNYGAMWATMNKAGLMSISWRGSTTSGTTYGAGGRQVNSNGKGAQIGCWTHVCITFESGADGRTGGFYFNGAYSSADASDIGSNIIDKGIDGFKSHRFYIGGTANDGRAGLQATIDDVQIWHKILNANEVKDAMNGYNHRLDQIPPELVGYWSFETVNEDNTIPNLSPYKNITTTYTGSSASNYGTRALVTNAAITQEGESENWTKNGDDVTSVNGTYPNDQVLAPPIVAGNPALTGTFSVQTKGSWKLDGSAIQGTPTGNATAGSAVAQYALDGTYVAKAYIENDWGKDSLTLNYIIIDDWTVALEKTESSVEADVYPNPFVNAVNMKFEKAGNYTVEVFDMTGKMVLSRQTAVQDNDMVQVSMDGEAGLYIFKIRNEAGKLLKALKVEKK